MTETQGASESGKKVGDESGNTGCRHLFSEGASVSDEQLDVDSLLIHLFADSNVIDIFCV